MADDGDEEKKRAEAEAEARRKRIMEKSKDRMNKVSGLQEEADDETDETKATSSARMQAMRKRRFKKGGKSSKAADESTAGKTEETTAEKAEEVPTDAVGNEGETAPATEQGNKEEPVALEPSKVEAENESNIEVNEEECIDETTTPMTSAVEETAAATESQKKYKGVAKMRREKMLQKKKEEAAKAADEDAKAPAFIPRQTKRMKQPILPILMYILTTMLLFLAGLDVGLQYVDPEYILVNREFAPQQFTFQKLIPWSSSSSSAFVKDLGTTEGHDGYARDLTEQSDEFDTVGSDDVDYVPNIDPLFRVDLDEITRGPGIVNQLGRGAVKIHRMILYVLWELPWRLFALPAQLIRYPPVLCLAALCIRQLIAKVVLGAALPTAIEEDVRTTKEMADILTMIKNTVKSTVAGAFPTAVTAFEAFQLLRVDMYVLLCGVFVGLLYSTWAPAHVLEEGMPDIVVPDPVEVDGIADEL
jgi:hypothetical protein